MKTNKFLTVMILLGLLLYTAFPVETATAGRMEATASSVLKPLKIVTQRGATSGNVSGMRVRDQSGTADNPANYVLFKTPGVSYHGYRTYKLPSTISAGDVKSIQVRVNFKGLPKAKQIWIWYLYDWVQNTWVKAGDNADAVEGVWKYFRFMVSANPYRFVNNTTHEIRLKLISSKSTGDAKLDYEALAVTYNTCTDPLGCVTVYPSQPVHIAYLLAMSGGGQLGVDERNGVLVAIDDAGGKILNHPVKFDGKDSACNPSTALPASQQMVLDASIVAVIGTSCSGAAAASMPVFSPRGFSMVSPSNTKPSLTDSGNPENYPGYLRASWNDNWQAERAAQYAWDSLGVTSVATIDDGGAYSTWMVEAFTAQFAFLGGTIAGQETIDPDQTDMSVPLANIAAASPDLVYLPVFTPAGGYLIDQARSTAGLETTYLMGTDSLFTADLETTAGGDIEGFLVTNADSSLFSAEYDAQFVPAFNAKFGHDPETLFSAYAYDAFMMIKAAIEQAAVLKPDGSLQIGRQALRNALYGTTSFAGLTGTLTCSDTGDCADPDVLAVFEYHFGAFPPTRVWP